MLLFSAEKDDVQHVREIASLKLKYD